MIRERETLQQYWLRIAAAVATRSTCPRRQVGAVITNERGQVLAMGYNGVPRNFPHCIDLPCPGANDQSGDSSRCDAVHAELNAILQLRGNMNDAFHLYTTTTPCFNCAKVIANTNIRHVWSSSEYTDVRGAEILKRAGINLIITQLTPMK